MGWRIDNTAKWLSFDASLNSVTSTGASFYFNPSTYSQIVYAQFGLALLKNRPGIVKMIYCVHNSILGNGVTSQTLSFPVGTTFGPDTTVYKAKAIISSLTMPYAGPHYWAQTLHLTCLPILPNQNIQNITLSTHYQTITMVTFTYILLDLSSMVPLPLIYFERFVSYWHGLMIKIPAQFDFRQNYNCLIGVEGISTSWLSGYHQLSLTPSNSTDISIAYDLKVVSIWQFYYATICTGGQCTNGTVVNPTASLYLCNPCVSYMAKCSTCSAYNICTSCDPFFTILQPLNASCVACPTNCLNCTKIGTNMTCQICIASYYYNGAICSPCLSDCLTCNASTTCLTCAFGWPVTGGCTNITFCQIVATNSLLISKCLKCVQPWILGIGVCLNTSGCINASYVWSASGYLSTCTDCDTLMHFDPLAVNGSCKCSVGYTIHRTTRASCIKCPANCLICVQSNNIGVCLQCISSYILIHPLNTTCLKVPPHCLNYTILSGYVSCDICEDDYFRNNSNPLLPHINQCPPCLIDCLTCISDMTCTACKYGGVPVLGGCTSISFCQQVKRNVLIPAKCLDCIAVYQYKLFLGLCVNITGCIVPHLLGNAIICLSCNSALKFKSVPFNNSCICSDGYTLDPISLSCFQICGDGKLSDYQCDDGNLQDGDGCSSKCTVQDRFACIDGDPTNPSRCIYLLFDIKLKVKNINKVFMENKGVFTFQISPHLSIYKKIDFQKMYGVQTQRLSKVLSVKFADNKIKVQVDFTEDLQTFPASFQIQLPKKHFLQKKVKVEYDMISDDVKLIIISNRQQMLLYIQIAKIISILALCVFAVGSLTHKMIGLETLVPIQIIYLTHLLNNNVTPIYSMLSFFANSVFNLLHSENHFSSIAAGNPSTYSEENEGVAMWAMLLLAFTATIVFCVIVALRILTEREDERIKPIKQERKRLRIVAMLSEMGYSHFIFPFLMGTFCVYWPLSVAYEHGKTALGSASLRLGGLQGIALGLVFFYEWKETILQESGERQSFFKLRRCSRGYVPLFLTYLFAVVVLLCLGYIQIIAAELFLTVTITIALIFFIVYRPYEDCVHNVGIIFNSAITVAFSWWNSMRNFFPALALENNEETAIMAIIGAVILCLVFATVRIIFHFRGVLKEGICSELKQEPQKTDKTLYQKITVEEVRDGDSHLKLLPFHKQYLLKCGLQEEHDSIKIQTPVNYFQKKWEKPAKFNSKFDNSRQQLRSILFRK